MSAALIALITQIVGLAVSLAPEIAQEAELAITLFKQQTPVTSDQEAQVRAALDAMAAKVAAAVATASGQQQNAQVQAPSPATPAA